MKTRSLTTFVALTAILAGCSTTPPPANIQIEDRRNYRDELFRYVIWKGENYGPLAFLSTARGAGLRELRIDETQVFELSCAVALAAELNIPVFAAGSAVDTSAAPTVKEACTRPRNIPRPELAEGQIYIVETDNGFAIEGEAVQPRQQFYQSLKSQGIHTVVLREMTIGGMLCLGTIAVESGLTILQVQPDGTLSPVAVTGGNGRGMCPGGW